MIWDTWTNRWQKALEACRRLGGETSELTIHEPAAEAEVIEVERQLQTALPASFRQVVTQFSSAVEFDWFMPDGFLLPPALQGIFNGECAWSLERLIEIESGYKEWLKYGFPDPNSPYDAVWHNVLAFHKVANGDLLGFDLAIPTHPVIYLSHDGGEGHGYQLGANFADFIDRLTRLGCPGSEDWQMMPLFLDPGCENALLWRNVFGLNL